MKRRALLAAAGAAALWQRAQVQAAERRIVSVGGALTETLYALGGERELVGVDTTSLYPVAARALPSVGYARALSAEGLLSLRPTLVVASAEAGPPAVLRQVEAARVDWALLDSGHRFEGVLERTAKLAALCGRDAAGQQLVARLREEWAAALVHTTHVARAAQATRPPRVLFVLSHSMSQVRVSGRNTAADAMVAYAGGANPLADVDGYKPLTPEAAVAAAPDVILATEQGLEAAGGIDGLLKSPGLAQTPAGRARRVVALDALFMLGFGPRLPQAVVALANALHTKSA
jgi:iron complex transport system substrate-binding protein